MTRATWFDRVGDVIDRIPTWLRPAALGAVLLGAMVSIRMVLALPLILAGKLGEATQAFIVLAVAMGAGAVGGLAYSLVGRPLLRVPFIGRYLTGMVCIAAYLTPLLLLSHRIFPNEKKWSLSKPSDLIIWAFCVGLFGIVMGHTWFEAPARRSISPKRAA